ncbi:hypothetical protein [Blastococcus brunescens]|uniref:hypothetical protein n=1 Tax=Blastococcus brunescens TaxID=1564165 RepID=UPI003BEEFC51
MAVGGQRLAVVGEVGQPGGGAAGVLVQDGAPSGGQLSEQGCCPLGFCSGLFGAGQRMGEPPRPLPAAAIRAAAVPGSSA